MTRIDPQDDAASALQSQAIAQPAAQRPVRPRYTLDELMKECDPQLPISDEDQAWLDDYPAGREAL